MDASIKQDVAHNDEFWNYFKKKNALPVSVTIQLEGNSEYTVTDNNFLKPKLTSTASMEEQVWDKFHDLRELH